MRFHPTRGAMSLGKSKGGLPPDNCVEEEPAALEAMKVAIETTLLHHNAHLPKNHVSRQIPSLRYIGGTTVYHRL